MLARNQCFAHSLGIRNVFEKSHYCFRDMVFCFFWSGFFQQCGWQVLTHNHVRTSRYSHGCGQSRSDGYWIDEYFDQKYFEFIWILVCCSLQQEDELQQTTRLGERLAHYVGHRPRETHSNERFECEFVSSASNKEAKALGTVPRQFDACFCEAAAKQLRICASFA